MRAASKGWIECSLVESLWLPSLLVLETDNQAYIFALHCCDKMAEMHFKRESSFGLQFRSVSHCHLAIFLCPAQSIMARRDGRSLPWRRNWSADVLFSDMPHCLNFFPRGCTYKGSIFQQSYMLGMNVFIHEPLRSFPDQILSIPTTHFPSVAMKMEPWLLPSSLTLPMSHAEPEDVSQSL